ncbi:SatD family protein [Terrabacter sp. BE26]|uniref:SatD family protein n=1 Tax=Terrabacter sp. BE26 TaxID=2898152 RepID=UPI0035BE8DC4
MADLKVKASAVALIGDIVESRTHRNRQALHDRFQAAVSRANTEVPAQDPAVITVGDEFQGVYPTLGAALRASFIVRDELHPLADVRFGLGRGDVTTLDPARGIHDGPAYWAAREAIEIAEAKAQRAQTRTSRTAYVSPDEPPAMLAAVQAALDCLDFMVGSMSTTSREILGGLMHGLAQHDVAERVGISPSAVSQRVRRDGIGVALEAMATLGDLP